MVKLMQPQEETGMKLGRKTVFYSQVPEKGSPRAMRGPGGSVGLGQVAEDRSEGKSLGCGLYWDFHWQSRAG